MFWKKKPKKANPAGYPVLRGTALAVTAEELKLSRTPGGPKVWGLMTEFRIAGFPVTLVAFADGGVSLYFGNGGGVIGAGQHEPIRAAANILLAVAENSLEQFSPGDDDSLPEKGEVRYHLRTFDGPMSWVGREPRPTELDEPRFDLFRSAQNVITQIRLRTPR